MNDPRLDDDADHDGPPSGLDDPDPAGLGPPRPSGADALDRARALLPASWQDGLGLGRVSTHLVPWAGVVVAIGLLVVVGWLLVGRSTGPEGGGSSSDRLDPVGVTASTRPVVPTGPGGTGPSRDPGTTVPAVVQVHAAGAVVAPGVHRLPAGARVADLVAAAGGLAPDADVDRVNLAALLVDGSRVYVPRRGEVAVPDVPSGSGSGGGSGAGGATTVPKGPVDINRATVDELDTLPGVGPTTAQAIIDHRNRNGPFRSVEDLGKVRGIGPAKLAELRPLVTV